MAVKLIEMGFKNFKSLKEAKFNLKDNITGIYGENGTGKTSIVEAWELLASEFKMSISSDKYLNESIEGKGNIHHALLEKYRKYLTVNQDQMELSLSFQIDNFVYVYKKKVVFDESEYVGNCEILQYYNINAKSKVYDIFEREVNTSSTQSLLSYSLFGNIISLSLDEVSSSDLTKLNSVGGQMPLLINK